MPARLVALDEGTDIPLDRVMVVVGRHPQCDARLDSLRVSRHHCCMTTDHGEVLVRDLGSTNGIRINGQRVEFGRLRPGDELSIAHIRYRLDNGLAHDLTLADGRSHPHLPMAGLSAADPPPPDPDEPAAHGPPPISPFPPPPAPMGPPPGGDNALAAAVRGLLPSGVADRCRIQVIVQMPDNAPAAQDLEACRPDSRL